LIILDTNAIIYAVKQKISIERFVDEEIGVPSSVIEELSELKMDDSNARIGIDWVKKYKILKVQKKGDEGVIEAATRYGGTVITNDAALRKNLKDKNIRSTTISKGKIRT